MISEINVADLHNKLNAKENFTLIDCREVDEWRSGHVEEAQLIPLSIFEHKYKEILTDKNQAVIIMCRSGARSMRACVFLNDQGYANLINLNGGILGWMEEGYKVITGE